MVDLELAYTPAVELARLIRTKAVSPVEVMDNALARIEAIDAALNCFAFVYPEEASALATTPSIPRSKPTPAAPPSILPQTLISPKRSCRNCRTRVPRNPFPGVRL